MLLSLDSKIGDQEANKFLTALIDDQISNLEKKMEDYFLTIFSMDSAVFYCRDERK